MSRLHRSNGVVANTRDIQKKGGLNASPYNERREAFRRGELVADEGHAVCTECYRIVQVRVNGLTFAHNHCPRGGTPAGEVTP